MTTVICRLLLILARMVWQGGFMFFGIVVGVVGVLASDG